MAGNGYYPEEFGVEVGERCQRDHCTGRIVFEPETECDESCGLLDCPHTDTDDVIADGNICSDCGWRASYD